MQKYVTDWRSRRSVPLDGPVPSYSKQELWPGLCWMAESFDPGVRFVCWLGSWHDYL